MRLALFEPDIPQNAGAILRLAACFGLGVDIVEPCGFVWDDRRLKRVAMDYAAAVEPTRHVSWQTFDEARTGQAVRLVLFTTSADRVFTDFDFRSDDILLFGRESAGVPDNVRRAADECLRIPLVGGARSLNLAQAAAMAVSEALRQTGGFAP